MPLRSRLTSLWLNLVHHGRIERDLDDELRAVRDALVEEKILAGLPPDSARRAAAVELGVESTKEYVRQVRAGSSVETALRDLRHAARLLVRHPLFAVTAALSLSLGIGATTTVFTVVNTLLLSAPDGVSGPDRLVEIARQEEGDAGLQPISYPDYLAVRERATSFEDVYACALDLEPLSVRGAGVSERVFGAFTTMNYFSVLGVRAAVGRLFEARDGERPGQAPVIVLSYAYWTRRFDRDPAVVGRELNVNARPMVVVGVASPEFRGTTILAPDAWLPALMIPELQPDRALDFSPASRVAWQAMLGGRLRTGVSVRQASAEMATIGEALEREHEEVNRFLRSTGIPGPNGRMTWFAATASLIPAGVRLPVAGFLALMMGLVAIVLVIASANLAGVLLARGVSRRREMALRVAVGAARSRLIRQLLTETVLLFTAGGLAGLALARALTSLLVKLLPDVPRPVNLFMPLDGRVLTFSLAASLVAALCAGLYPALQASKSDVVSALNDDSQGPSDRLRLRGAFVVAQVALSLLLVLSAGLLVRAIDRLGPADPGYEALGVHVATVDLSMAGYTNESGPVFVRNLLERARALPGVRVASIADRPPGQGGLSLGGVIVPGAVPPSGQPYFFANWSLVESGYFDALKIPFISGRDFGPDDRAGSPRVAIVSASTAERLWPGKDAVGQVLSVALPDPRRSGAPPTVPLRVVGVVRDISTRDFRGVTPLSLYVPFAQHYMPRFTLFASADDERPLASDLRALLTSMNPNLPVDAEPLARQQAGPTTTTMNVAAAVAAGAGAAGLLLAAIGVYGVTAYVVARRTREIGVRLALGATPARIASMVVRQGMTLVGLGSAIGLVLGEVAALLLASSRIGAPPPEAATFAATALLFAGVGLMACYVPVWRAVRIGATEALRHQ